MVYIPAFDKCILCPPKNGTHTIRYVADRIGEDVQLKGHMTAGTVVARLGRAPHFAMTVRDPVERFLSIVNYFSEGRYTGPDVEMLWKTFEGIQGEFWAKPQAYWCEDWPVTLFPFEGLPIVRWIGWQGEVPHRHPTPVKSWSWTLERIEPIVDRVKEHFAQDYTLRELAQMAVLDPIGFNDE